MLLWRKTFFIILNQNACSSSEMTLLTRLVGVGFQIMLTANLGICLAFYVTLQNCTDHADLKKKVYASNTFFIFMIFMIFGSVIGSLACILLSIWMQQNLILKKMTMRWFFSFCRSKAYSTTSEVWFPSKILLRVGSSEIQYDFLMNHSSELYLFSESYSVTS